MTVALILVGALFTVASCWAAGRLVFQWAGLPSELTGALSFGTGAAVVSSAMFALCALQIVSLWSIVLLGLALIAVQRRLTWTMPKWTLWWIPVAVFGLWYFVNALAPETSADGTFYHLGLPARYLKHGGFYRITTNFYANLSQGMEMLFLMAFAIGRHSAAALTHLSFLFALAAGLVAYGRWIAQPAAGWLAALIVFTSPVIGVDATVAYNDVALAAVLFLLFVALMRWDADRARGWLIAAGLLAGLAYGIKYTGALATPYAIGFVVWRSRSWKAALIPAAFAIALIAPWMIKNWLWLDNPVTPFFNRQFPNPYVSIAFEDLYRSNLRHFNEAQLGWRILLDVTLTGSKVQGNLGPAFLLLPITIAGMKSQEVRRLMFAGALFMLPWFANVGTRFLIPCAAFFALSIAISVARWKMAVPMLAVGQIICSWPAIAGTYSAPDNWRLSEWPIAAALRRFPEEDFIASRLDSFSVMRMIERNTPSDAVIYSGMPFPESYSDRTYLLGYAGAINQSIEQMLVTPFTTDIQPIVRLTFRPNASNVQRIRIVQKGGCVGPWSIAEIRWTPDRTATLSSKPEPWNVQWARDGNPATRWKLGQSARRDQYFEAAFAQPTALDTVEIDTAPDETNTCIELQTQSPAGRQTFPNPPEIQAIPLPLDIRRQITQAIRDQGVTHLLILSSERGANDFETRQQDWGITKAGETGSGRLYRIDAEPKNIQER